MNTKKTLLAFGLVGLGLLASCGEIHPISSQGGRPEKCSALARKEVVEIPVSGGSWAARPTAYVTFGIEGAEASSVKVNGISILPEPFSQKPPTVRDPETLQLGFRPASLGVHNVMISLGEPDQLVQCSTTVDFRSVPADPDTIYIDEEWLGQAERE